MQKEMKQPALSGACQVDEEKPPESWQVAEAEGRALTPQEREAREDYRHRELFADRFFPGFYARQKKQYRAEQEATKAAAANGEKVNENVSVPKRWSVCLAEVPEGSGR